MTTDNAPELTRFAKQTVHPVVVRNGMLVCESCGAVARAASVTPPEGLDAAVADVRYAGGSGSDYWRGFNDGIDRLAARLAGPSDALTPVLGSYDEDVGAQYVGPSDEAAG